LKALKRGDKVTLIRNIHKREFDSYGNEPPYVEAMKIKKFVTISEVVFGEKALKFIEIPQYWKEEWFIPYNQTKQLEFDFTKIEK